MTNSDFTPGLQSHAPAGMRTFSLERVNDVTGVSGTGIVLEGVVFSTGAVCVHWLTPAPMGSLSIWTSFSQFMEIHVSSHPGNESRIHWADGEVWEPGDYNANSSPYRTLGGLGKL